MEPSADLVTPLQQRCISLNEFYTELVAAGFSRKDAMDYLIGYTRPIKGAR